MQTYGQFFKRFYFWCLDRISRAQLVVPYIKNTIYKKKGIDIIFLNFCVH